MVDVHSGQIGHQELQKALSKGGWQPFALRTVVLLINMFDADRSGTIGYREFEQLLGSLTRWKEAFVRFDTDRSGTIGWSELAKALATMGYSLNERTLDSLARVYQDKRTGTIALDGYIQVRVGVTWVSLYGGRVATGQRRSLWCGLLSVAVV